MTDGAEQHLIAFPSIVEFIGGSTAAENARAALGRTASVACPVLIVAEQGLDPTAVARAVHDRSAQFTGPFVVVECAAEDAARLEAQIFGTPASGGTLVLTNLQELPTRLQARLARVLRDGQLETDETATALTFDARVIASVSGSLDEVVQAGTLRRELIARFTQRIDVPPLRQRPADIPTLIGCLVGESAMAAHLPAPTFTREALTLLAALPWRRNLDELREVLDLLVRAAVGGTVRLEDVLDHIPVERMTSGHGTAASLREARLSFERHYIATVLNRHRGRMDDAARSLGIQRTNLYRKVRQLGIGLRRARAFLAFLLLPTAVSAQILAPREAAQIELGPLSLYPSLRVIDAGIDENVFNDAENPKEDFTFTVASRALAVLRLGLNELMFSSGSDYVWFKEYGSQRSSNAMYAARLNLSASRFKPFIGAERIRTRARVSPEIDERAQRIERLATAGSSFSLTERTAIILSAQWASSTYEDGEQFRGTRLDTALNDTARSFTAGTRYTLTPFTTLAVTGNYNVDTFPDSHFRDSKSYSVTPLLEFAPEAAIRGRFSAGYQVFAPEDPELPDNKGVIVEGALNWAISGVTTFDVIVGRNVNYSYQATQPYYLQTGARLAVTQRLFGPFGLHGSVDRQHLSYRWRRGVDPTGLGDRVDISDVLSGGVMIRLGRGFGVLLGAEQTRRRSSEDVKQNFRRTRLLCNVTVGQ